MESQVFSYILSEKNEITEGLDVVRKFGKYYINTDSKTPYLYSSNSGCECIVFGYAVDLFSEDSYNLAERILSKCHSIFDVIEFEKSLGGKYVIFYRLGMEYYIVGDATCSIPIYYIVEKQCVCSSNMNYLVSKYNLKLNLELQSIRDKSDISQAMPYDITPYREIKQLLPNHYLYLNENKTIRFINFKNRQKKLSIEEANEYVRPLIRRLCAFYCNNAKIYCPITSGKDSRTVLAFLLSNGEDVNCYTLKHKEHNNNSQDLVIPSILCSQNELLYKQIEDVELTRELKTRFDKILGENSYSHRSAVIAQTIAQNYTDGAILNGDIIGQIGKCSLHRDIPEFFATPSYFRCKMHNHCKSSKHHIKKWKTEVDKSGEKVNIFDLFSIENRMGRWAAQTSVIYNSIGQLNLNIFNSRSIIYTWTAVDRKERKTGQLQLDLIKKEMPSLLDVPFESDKNILIRFSKCNGVVYLACSYLKYFLEGVKQMINERTKK